MQGSSLSCRRVQMDKRVTDLFHNIGKRLTGTFLGSPYDWRLPTWERLKRDLWDPQDQRLYTPKSFGWGYSFNLAEVARRFHLRR
jgi:hypothetical protein